MDHTQKIGTDVVPEPASGWLARWVDGRIRRSFLFIAIPAALLVLAEIDRPFRGHRLTIRIPLSDRLVGRTRRHSVPVARHAGISGRLPARRAYADDGHRWHDPSGSSVVPRRGSRWLPRWRSCYSSFSPLTSSRPTRCTSQLLLSGSSTPGAPRRCRSALA